MASRPFIDKRSAVWYMKYKPEKDGPWVKVRLGPHGEPFPPSRPPKKPPRHIDDRAAEFREIEWRSSQRLPTGQARETGLAGYVAAYVTNYAGNKRPGSVANLRRHAKTLLAFADSKGVKSVQAVNKQFVREYLEHRIKTVSANTLKTERGFLAPVWTQAVNDELIAANPWRLVKLPAKVTVSDPRFWSPEQVSAIVRACDEEWLSDLVLVLANTGIRIRSALAMRFAWVDWDKGVVAVPKEHDKAGRGYTVALSRVSRDVLQRRDAASAGGRESFVFPAARGRRPRSYDRAHEAFRKAVAKSGVPRGTLHDLRHTFGRLLCRSRVPLNVVRASLGHSSLQMTARYTEVDGEEAVQFFEGFGVGDDPAA